MQAHQTRYAHIVIDNDGVPHIAGTTMKVIELVLAQSTYGWSPAELHFQYPHLSLGQIHSALAFYWDHQEDLDQDIARRRQQIARSRQSTPSSPLLARLKPHG
ncbi:MAG: DUF433 domain-containing protein [Chloroflexi bacterium AL-W]|nr:DUF433 domain-containing protein [Chloroflexi bacterium AL-N1]NOK68407.1 DUF433 domain-containing protein [Chloroflexi bacterium AL-N10]NOK74053.1 DUF433 domain-containing protein [Chloroflexi bacterium AL-N5]NOK83021.1 DUF433 domain-containing protein [Chloroflexi bacterium AL-W]NOK90543.1 DUF433 domain-containing protein [Chloroflexi bacterium AL-N15]